MTALGPGTMVKCVRKPKEENTHGFRIRTPEIGSVHRVEEVIDDPMNGCGILLPTSSCCPCCNIRNYYRASNFTPLDDDSVDLSALTEALNKGPVEGEHDQRVRVVERVR